MPGKTGLASASGLGKAKKKAKVSAPTPASQARNKDVELQSGDWLRCIPEGVLRRGDLVHAKYLNSSNRDGYSYPALVDSIHKTDDGTTLHNVRWCDDADGPLAEDLPLSYLHDLTATGVLPGETCS